VKTPTARLFLALCAVSLLALGATGCARKAVQSPPAPPAVPPVTEAVPAPTEPETAAPAAPTGVTSADFVPAFFAFDSYALGADARSALDANARLLRGSGDVRVTIEGHCDERGTAEYNLALGERRANAARDYLVAAGIATHRIQTVSYGKERPFEEGHDEASWAKNRRAHVVVR
jgi:peptidoglycan-associated lipoprotein